MTARGNGGIGGKGGSQTEERERGGGDEGGEEEAKRRAKKEWNRWRREGREVEGRGGEQRGQMYLSG